MGWIEEPPINAPTAVFLPALSIAFAAFWIWLTLRAVNRREQWAIWLAVTLGMFGYVAALCVVIDKI
jgi:hypothetical protein